MKKLLLSCIGVVLAAALVLGGRAGLEKWRHHQAQGALRTVVLQAMKDPATVQWRNEVLSPDKTILCGELNAKNSLGGYVGFRRYIANRKGYLIQGAPFSTWALETNRTPVPDYMSDGAKLVDGGAATYLARDVFEFFWKSNCG